MCRLRVCGPLNVTRTHAHHRTQHAQTASSRFSPKETYNFAGLRSNRTFLTDSFHGYSAKAALFKAQNPQPMDVAEELSKIFSSEGGAHAFAQITRVIRYLKVHKEYAPPP